MTWRSKAVGAGKRANGVGTNGTRVRGGNLDIYHSCIHTDICTRFLAVAFVSCYTILGQGITYCCRDSVN